MSPLGQSPALARRLPPILLLLVAASLGSGPAGAVPAAEPDSAGRGLTSWYGPGFHGRRMANGERFDQWGDSCASRRFAFGTVLRLTNPTTGRQEICVVRDRGPYIAGRVLDVSRGTARRLGMEAAGVARIEIEIVR